jgi:hypothetical protein
MATARFTWMAMLSPALFACGTSESPTDLDPEGPPMVREVFLTETQGCPGGRTSCQILAYGTHPDAIDPEAPDGDMKRPVTNAAPVTGQRIRIVMDELLIGNYLEEIACNAVVDEDQYQSVPVGATPDDIAACAVAADVLHETCTGEFAVCLGPNGPVGVLDEDGDGTSDDTQFIDGAVGLRCRTADGDEIIPAINLQATYWQPSGNQQVPAAGGFDALGPAIVLNAAHGLPTATTCQIVFADNVTDRAGNPVCGPKYGGEAPDTLEAWPPPFDCTPGDTTEVTFGVDILRVLNSIPADGAVNVRRIVTGETYGRVIVNFNAEVAIASVEDFTLTPTPPGAVTVEAAMGNNRSIEIHVEGGFAPTTTYTLTIPAPTDYYGQPLGQSFTISFTTAA